MLLLSTLMLALLVNTLPKSMRSSTWQVRASSAIRSVRFFQSVTGLGISSHCLHKQLSR
jgi:hypothetical protein